MIGSIIIRYGRCCKEMCISIVIWAILLGLCFVCWGCGARRGLLRGRSGGWWAMAGVRGN
jgi:hypothetical protein